MALRTQWGSRKILLKLASIKPQQNATDHE